MSEQRDERIEWRIPCNDQDGHTFAALHLTCGTHTCTCGGLTLRVYETPQWATAAEPPAKDRNEVSDEPR